MASPKKILPVPRPGARAARRRVLATEYQPRFELCRGDDPWESVSESYNDSAPLTPEECANLGLSMKPVVY
jgi:hypothetical protein